MMDKPDSRWEEMEKTLDTLEMYWKRNPNRSIGEIVEEASPANPCPICRENEDAMITPSLPDPGRMTDLEFLEWLRKNAK